MEYTGTERRRAQRIPVNASVMIRRVGGANDRGEGSFHEQMTKDVSLGGTYFETETPDTYAINDVVVASVIVPVSHERLFPFRRVAGPGRVVRISPLAEGERSNGAPVGIAVEFGREVTALTALPTRTH